MRIVASLTSALAVAVVLLLPAPAGADHDNTCHAGGVDGNDVHSAFVWQTARQTGTVGLSIGAGGEVRPFGAVRLEAGVLLPQADGSSAQCADANGNGAAGLTLAEIALADVRTGRPGLAVLRPAEGEDIDASGVYPGTLEICIGNDCTRTDVEIRAVAHGSR